MKWNKLGKPNKDTTTYLINGHEVNDCPTYPKPEHRFTLRCLDYKKDISEYHLLPTREAVEEQIKEFEDRNELHT